MARTIQRKNQGSNMGWEMISHPNQAAAPPTPPQSQSQTQSESASKENLNFMCNQSPNRRERRRRTISNSNNNKPTSTSTSTSNTALPLSRNTSNSNLNQFFNDQQSSDKIESLPPTPPSTNQSSIPLPTSTEPIQHQEQQNPSPIEHQSSTPVKKSDRKRERPKDTPIKSSSSLVRAKEAGKGGQMGGSGPDAGLGMDTNMLITPSNSTNNGLNQALDQSGRIDYNSPNPRPRFRKKVGEADQEREQDGSQTTTLPTTHPSQDRTSTNQSNGNVEQHQSRVTNNSNSDSSSNNAPTSSSHSRAKPKVKNNRRIVSGANYKPNQDSEDSDSIEEDDSNQISNNLDDSFLAEDLQKSNVLPPRMIIKETFLPQAWQFSKPKKTLQSDLSIALNRNQELYGDESMSEGNESQIDESIQLSKKKPQSRKKVIPKNSTPVIKVSNRSRKSSGSESGNESIKSNGRGKGKGKSSLSKDITESILKGRKSNSKVEIKEPVKRGRKSLLNTSTPSSSKALIPKTEPVKKIVKRKSLLLQTPGSSSLRIIKGNGGGGRKSFGIKMIKPEIGESTLENAVQPESPGDDPLLLKGSERIKVIVGGNKNRKSCAQKSGNQVVGNEDEKVEDEEEEMAMEMEMDVGDQSFDGTRFKGRMKGDGKMLGEGNQDASEEESENQEVDQHDVQDDAEKQEFGQDFQDDGVDFFDGNDGPVTFDASASFSDDESEVGISDEEKEVEGEEQQSSEREDEFKDQSQSQEQEISSIQQESSNEVTELLNEESGKVKPKSFSHEAEVDEEQMESKDISMDRVDEQSQSQDFDDDEEEDEEEEEEEDEIIFVRSSSSPAPNSNPASERDEAQDPPQDANSQSEETANSLMITSPQTQAERDAEARAGEEPSISFVQSEKEVEEDESVESSTDQSKSMVSGEAPVGKEFGEKERSIEEEVEQESEVEDQSEALEIERQNAQEVDDSHQEQETLEIEDWSMQKLEQEAAEQEDDSHLLDQEEFEEENPDESMGDILSSEASMRDIAEAAARADGEAHREEMEVEQSFFLQPDLGEEEEEDQTDEEIEQEDEETSLELSEKVRGKLRAASATSSQESEHQSQSEDEEAEVEQSIRRSVSPIERSRDQTSNKSFSIVGNDISISRAELHRRVSKTLNRSSNVEDEDQEEEDDDDGIEVSMNQSTKNISISINRSSNAVENTQSFQSGSGSMSKSRVRILTEKENEIQASHSMSTSRNGSRREILEISSLDPRETARAVAALKAAGYYDEGWLTTEGGDFELQEEGANGRSSFPQLVLEEEESLQQIAQRKNKKRQREEASHSSSTPLKSNEPSSTPILATPIFPGAFPKSPSLQIPTFQSSSSKYNAPVFEASTIWSKASWAALDKTFVAYIHHQSRELISSSQDPLDKYEARKLAVMDLVSDDQGWKEVLEIFKEQNGIEERSCKDLWASERFRSRIRALSASFIHRLNEKHPGVVTPSELASFQNSSGVDSFSNSFFKSSYDASKNLDTSNKLQLPASSTISKVSKRLSFGSPFRNGTHSTPLPTSKSSTSRVSQLRKEIEDDQESSIDDSPVGLGLVNNKGMVSNLLNRAKRLSGVFGNASETSSPQLRERSKQTSEVPMIQEMSSINARPLVSLSKPQTTNSRIEKIYPSIPTTQSKAVKRNHTAIDTSIPPPPPPPPQPTATDLSNASKASKSRDLTGDKSTSSDKDLSTSSSSINKGRNSNSISFSAEDILNARRGLKKRDSDQDQRQDGADVNKSTFESRKGLNLGIPRNSLASLSNRLEQLRQNPDQTTNPTDRSSSTSVTSTSKGLVSKRISDANLSFNSSIPQIQIDRDQSSSRSFVATSNQPSSNVNLSIQGSNGSRSSFVRPTVLVGFSPNSHELARNLGARMKESRKEREWKSPSKRKVSSVKGKGRTSVGDASFENSRSFWKARHDEENVEE